MLNKDILIPSDPSWLNKQTILLGKVGSHAYGTATETSDLDFKGVVVPPKSYFMGLDSFNGYDKAGGKNFKNISEDVDLTLIHINKFVRDCMAGVPNNLELLFLEKEDYVHLDSRGEDLINIRQRFLSKQIMKKYGGYAKSQAMKMQSLKSNGAARQDLIDAYGYDSKFYMHTVRLLGTAIEILSTGKFTTKRPNADFLVSLRKGHHSLEEALEHITLLELGLNAAYKNSALPEEPDYEFINSWLTRFNMNNSSIRM